MTTLERQRRRSTGVGVSWTLSRRWRQGVLIAHIISAGAWIGVDVVVAILVLVGWFGSDLELRGLAYRALANFIVAPMLACAAIALVTGVLLGVGTKWGLTRYWWVLVKLVLNIALLTTMIVVLAPGMAKVDQYGASLPDGTAHADRIVTLFFPPAVSLTTLTFAVVLAVMKPWGRVRPATGRGRSR
ncbi:hypothetical protein [Gordonia aichiensis]|uniref:hypothetical protein n=1 Tax=Gordonia aichiensis TaxID=36820 RepID=UPI003265E1B3